MELFTKNIKMMITKKKSALKEAIISNKNTVDEMNSFQTLMTSNKLKKNGTMGAKK
jgi:hypothetical protein